MVSKYEDLALQAVELLADVDVIERSLKSYATLLVRGYAAHIEAPTERVRFVAIDADGRLIGEAMSLSLEAPLEQRPGGLWWMGMLIEYRHPQHPMLFMTEAIPFGFSPLDKTATAVKVHTLDGRAFEIRSGDDFPVLFEHIRLSTEKRLRDLLATGKPKIGFVD